MIQSNTDAAKKIIEEALGIANKGTPKTQTDAADNWAEGDARSFRKRFEEKFGYRPGC